MSKCLNLFFILLISGLFILTGCDNPADSDDDQDEHSRAVGLVIYSSGTTVVRYERDEAVNGVLTAPLGDLSDHYNIRFIAEDGDEFEPHLDESSLDWTIADTTVVSIWQHPDEEGGWDFHLRGKTLGTTTIRFKILHGDHADFTSQPIPAVVTDSENQTEI